MPAEFTIEVRGWPNERALAERIAEVVVGADCSDVTPEEQGYPWRLDVGNNWWARIEKAENDRWSVTVVYRYGSGEGQSDKAIEGLRRFLEWSL